MKWHNKELHNLYSSPNIRIIKSRTRWTGYVARLKKEELHTKFWLENLEAGDHSENPDVLRRITLK
jgi:hypothetical protein